MPIKSSNTLKCASLTMIEQLALQQLLDTLPEDQISTLSERELIKVLELHAKAVGFKPGQAEEFMMGGDI